MKLSQRDRVKKHLFEHGSITNVEAVEMKILRLSERIRELQELGLGIAGDWVRVDGKRTGTYRYTLVSAPKPRPKMVPITITRDGVRFTKFVPEGSQEAKLAAE